MIKTYSSTPSPEGRGLSASLHIHVHTVHTTKENSTHNTITNTLTAPAGRIRNPSIIHVVIRYCSVYVYCFLLQAFLFFFLFAHFIVFFPPTVLLFLFSLADIIVCRNGWLCASRTSLFAGLPNQSLPSNKGWPVFIFPLLTLISKPPAFHSFHPFHLALVILHEWSFTLLIVYWNELQCLTS